MLPLLFWLTFTTIGSFHIRWNYFIKANHSNPEVVDKRIALTFDDGPHEKFTPQVLDLLREHQIKASFFCIGKNVEKHPDIVKQIVREGHIIGNHSYSHSNLYGFLTTGKLIEDLTKNQNLIEQLTGLKMKLFRPPFGVTNPNIAGAVKRLKFVTMGWNIRSYDTVSKQPNRILERITQGMKGGDVVLLHDTSENTVLVLRKLLDFLKTNEFRPVALDELLNTEAYE